MFEEICAVVIIIGWWVSFFEVASHWIVIGAKVPIYLSLFAKEVFVSYLISSWCSFEDIQLVWFSFDDAAVIFGVVSHGHL